MAGRVVDASVVAAWCFREPRAAEALRLLRGVDLYAPGLLAYELASIARRKVTAYPENAQALSEALAAALMLPIRWSEVDHPAALDLALAADLTTYDASYLWLARALSIPLVTFDRRLAEAARGYWRRASG